ncbi:protein THYLAKOID ASSEMBLY 8, chloroplastic-like isoform X1 [Fagus crenata]
MRSSAITFLSSPLLSLPASRCMIVSMSDRSKNRRPLQKGRNPSTEAIQTVQALKRANKDHRSLDQVFHSKFNRLLKLDMVAVLRELLRQNECLLALKVFEDIRKEYWYKPQVSLYAEMITVLATNGLFEHVELLHSYLKAERGLNHELEGFNALLKTLISFNLTKLAMECYYLMKEIGCEPDKTSFKILITGLESNGETGPSAMVRQDAQMYYGECLEFLEEEEEIMVSK